MKKSISPKELALAIGVSESSVKRWVDAGDIRAGRTAGGHRRIPIPEAIRYVRNHDRELVQPEFLGLPANLDQLVESARSRQDLDRHLQELLLEGESDEVRGLITALFVSGRTVAEICDGPVRASLASIGELWHADSRGIYVEHRASEIVAAALAAVRTLMPAPADGPIAIGSAVTGDLSVLPTLTVSLVLQGEGFSSVNLGPNLPIDALQHAVLEHNPAIVWVSASHVTDGPGVRRSILAMLDRPGDVRSTLVAGGRAVDELQLPSHPRIFVARSLAELQAFARGRVTRD